MHTKSRPKEQKRTQPRPGKVYTVNVGANAFKREKKKAIQALKDAGFSAHEARRAVKTYLETGAMPEPVKK